MTHETPCNGAESRTLKPKQEAAALALAAGRSIDEAASDTNCGSRTIKSWLQQEPLFARRVSELRSEMTTQALGRLIAATTAAVDTLVGLLEAASETARCSAARCIIESTLKMREQLDLEARLKAVEDRLARGKIR